MSSADLTLQSLSFGEQDEITGWFERLYTQSTILGSIQPKGASVVFGNLGSYAKYPHTLYTPDIVKEGDQIVDPLNLTQLYELNTVGYFMPWLNQFEGYECEAVLKQFSNRDTSSGTWHAGTHASTTDVRSRHKKYIDKYFDPANIAGDYITQFDGADYPIKYLFNTALGIDTDLVFSIGQEPAQSLLDYRYLPYAFIESVPVGIYAVNKAGVTAANIIEQGEQELRRIVTSYPIVEGISRRSIQSSKLDKTDLGDRNYLWNTTVTIKYKRANDNYTCTDTLTYGSGETAGTFTFPNIVAYKNSCGNRDTFEDMPGRLGDYPYLLGAKSDTIDVTCDLDLGDWLRPQGSSSKTDSVPWQVFKDIVSNGAIDQTAQVLTVAGESHAVRLNGNLDLSANGHTITLHFTEYNADPADDDYKTRHGID